VGSGVGGLTATLAMRRAGLDVEVLERAPAASSIRVGGGLHLWANGMLALQHVGLADKVEAAGERISRLDWFAPEDGLLASADLVATAAKVGAPSVGIRRSDLLDVLLAEVGEGTIRFGAEVVAFTQDSGSATAALADGSEVVGEVLVVAAGVRSALRQQVARATALREPGVLVCQATVDGRDLNRAGHFAETWASTMRLGCYPVRDGISWFAFLRSFESDAARAGARELLLDRTQSWTAPGRDAIAATPPAAVGVAEVVAHEPLERWSDRRVTLLGDAAHAMTPFSGQGACQALEDAVVLAWCLREERDVPLALRRYESLRVPRTTEIWSRSWAGAVSMAQKNRVVDPRRRRSFAATFERVVWRQLEQSVAEPFRRDPNELRD
jgi:2-polyprenyl-6-methoxyphenol hydroxylase-like FAD-dependent oxidoreductase